MRPSRPPRSTSGCAVGRRSVRTSVLVTAALLCAGTTARADGGGEREADADGNRDVAAYRQAVERGQARFDRGEYEAARAAFLAAYEIHAEPILLFNVASTYRREGALDAAIAGYRAFLETATDDDARRALAERTIADLEAALARQADDDEPVAPGLDDDPADDIQLEHIDLRDLDAPTRPAPPADRAAIRLRWAGIGCVAVSILAGTAAIASLSTAHHAENALEGLAPGTPWDADQQATYDRGQAAQRHAWMWSAASAALVAGGVVLYVSGERRRDRAGPALTVAPAPGGATVSMSRRW